MTRCLLSRLCACLYEQKEATRKLEANIAVVIKAQAHVRGFLARKYFRLKKKVRGALCEHISRMHLANTRSPLCSICCVSEGPPGSHPEHEMSAVPHRDHRCCIVRCV